MSPGRIIRLKAGWQSEYEALGRAELLLIWTCSICGGGALMTGLPLPESYRKAVVPIHTEAASQFADIMPNVRVLRDGETAEITSLIG